MKVINLAVINDEEVPISRLGKERQNMANKSKRKALVGRNHIEENKRTA